MNRNNSNEYKTKLDHFGWFAIISHVYYYLIVYYYFVQENKIIEIIVNMRNNSNE